MHLGLGCVEISEALGYLSHPLQSLLLGVVLARPVCIAHLQRRDLSREDSTDCMYLQRKIYITFTSAYGNPARIYTYRSAAASCCGRRHKSIQSYLKQHTALTQGLYTHFGLHLMFINVITEPAQPFPVLGNRSYQ